MSISLRNYRIPALALNTLTTSSPVQRHQYVEGKASSTVNQRVIQRAHGSLRSSTKPSSLRNQTDLEVSHKQERGTGTTKTRESSTGAWLPRKRVSPDSIDGIRALHAYDPAEYSIDALSGRFKISTSAIQRILKSRWRPSEQEQLQRRERWRRRGHGINISKAALGILEAKKKG